MDSPGDQAVRGLRQGCREAAGFARFDAWAPVYEASALQDAYYGRLHRRVLGFARAAVPAPRRLLDVGCGTGRLLRAAASAFPDAELVGVDFSAGMLAQAMNSLRERGALARGALVRAESAALPFADGAFDIVTCTACSHHWQEPSAALAELRRITSADGLLILAHLLGVAAWDPPGAGHVRRRGVRIPRGLAIPLLGGGFRITDAALFAECPLMPATAVLCVRRR